ncbi:MAG: cytidine deaminase [Clostridia bacterium]|nr:cytidine deaminase [Clostridia bacterium]
MEEEIKLAIEARDKAYCKTFKVGAALKMKSGKIYTGCNINNQGIQSICAERVAFAKAISEGEFDFDYIIVVGGDTNADKLERCLPCGYCRQFMSEFVKSDFKIYAYYDGKLDCFSIEQLLPDAFNL